MNKDKKIIIGLVIIIIVLIVGGLAFYMGKNFKEESKPPVVDNNLPQTNQNNIAVPPVQNTQVNNIANNKKDCLPTTVPWLKVLSPNGGEKFSIGDVMQIKFTSCNVPGSNSDINNYNLQVYDAKSNEKIGSVSLSGAVLSQGILEWKIPSSVDVAKKYKAYLETGLFGMNGNEYSPTDESDNFFTINSATSTTLPQYISGQSGWPPVIKTSGERYSCIVGSVGMGGKTVTTERTINGKTYCVALVEEGAMGSNYKTYTYKTFGIQGSSETTTFTLRYQECGVYRDNSVNGGTEYNQCKTNQSNFSVDAIVGGLM